MPSISVLTPTIPERRDLLAEAVASVDAQTFKPIEHIVVTDWIREGTALTLNKCLAAATGEWVAVLADDDILYPNHLADLGRAATFAYDVVYGNCDCDWEIPQINRPFVADELATHNFIPATALIRRKTLLDVGGWPDEYVEDWELWKRILKAGGDFAYVDIVTWRYRRTGRPQKSFGTL